jgi:hypothetical protein
MRHTLLLGARAAIMVAGLSNRDRSVFVCSMILADSAMPRYTVWWVNFRSVVPL